MGVVFFQAKKPKNTEDQTGTSGTFRHMPPYKTAHPHPQHKPSFAVRPPCHGRYLGFLTSCKVETIHRQRFPSSQKPEVCSTKDALCCLLLPLPWLHSCKDWSGNYASPHTTKWFQVCHSGHCNELLHSHKSKPVI